MRSDSTGTSGLLTDALGSTLALVDSTGNLATQYTYDPFGNTVSSGQASTNPFQYTGRENDSTGLYYFRARYYSPSLQRFCNEDPLRFMAGMNFYSYVGNSPINGTDPSGLHGPLAHDQIIWNALHPCGGVSDDDIYRVQQGSRFADQKFQDPEYSYIHSMTDGMTDQTTGEAKRLRDDFVADQMKNAISVLNAGDRSDAMWLFGFAMHPEMDMTSPAHNWPEHSPHLPLDGEPRPWCGMTGTCSNTLDHGDDGWDVLKGENQPVTYTVMVANSGPSDAAGVTLTDTLSDGLDFVSTDQGPACTVAGQVVTCDLGTVPAGGSHPWSSTAPWTPRSSVPPYRTPRRSARPPTSRRATTPPRTPRWSARPRPTCPSPRRVPRRRCRVSR